MKGEQMNRVLVSNLMMLKERPRFEEEIIAGGWEPWFIDVDQFLSEERCLELAGHFDGWLAGDDIITRAVLERCLPRLRGIAKWGTGIDSIDLQAAEDLGVPVRNSPGAFSEAVSEVAIGYMLMLSRHLLQVDREVRNGGWPKPMGTGLFGRTCGIIGFGAIGRGIARRARGCGMTTIANDAMLAPGQMIEDTNLLSMEELIARSDVIALACNLTSESRHLINASRIAAMKPCAIVINVARGPVVDEAALIEGLATGKLGGAGLDVFEIEPLPMDSPLRRFDNVVLGSHNANNLQSAVEHVHANTMANLAAIMARS